MVTQKNLLSAVKWSLASIKGSVSEKIIQNSMAYKLRSMGVECQQEVVLPVLAGMFHQKRL
jgi:hypothetical protein